MTKNEFLERLREGLFEWPKEDTEKFIDYYREMIEDRIEGGMSENEAVAALGTPDRVVYEIRLESSLPRIVKNKLKKRSPWRISEILLLLLGSPIWLSILIALFAAFLTVYLCFWAVLATFWAVELAFSAWGIAGLIVSIVSLVQGNGAALLFYFGSALFASALAIFGFFGCLLLTKLFLRAHVKMIRMLKILLIGKGKQ